MRRDEAVLCADEHIAVLRRLGRKNVKPCAGNLTAVQGCGEVVFVDNGAARGIDKKRALFHF